MLIKMIKKMLAVLLSVVLLMTTAPVRSHAFELEAGTDVTVEDLQKTMEEIAQAAEKIKELTGTEQVASIFRNFMSVAGTVGTIMTAINGTNNFLKLIGVIDDPVAGGIDNILDQMKAVNTKLGEIDSKLNALATDMTKMAASQEFNNRGMKALSMDEAWRDFEYRYMESAMDAYMTEYNGMLINGLKSWCSSDEAGRKKSGIDNTCIRLSYLPDADGNELPVFSTANKLPAEYTRTVTLGKECLTLPDSFSFNINNFSDDLTDVIAENITELLNADDYTAFESVSFPMFTPEGKSEISDDKIREAAKDAVSVLIYRIGAAEVNADAAYVLAVSDWFANYCKHLLSANDGIDAMLKTFYLTHAFEFEVKEELPDFMNRIILKTGTYGTFITTLLGMSNDVTDTAKLENADILCKTIGALTDAREHALTGNDCYSYITNREVRYSECCAHTEAVINTKRVYNDTETYQSYKAVTGFNVYNKPAGGTYALLDKVSALVLAYTVENNTSESLHDYLNKNAAVITAASRGSMVDITDYGLLLLEQEGPSDLALDKSVLLDVFNVIGNDFSGKKTYRLPASESEYPDDADPDYINYHKKIAGSYMDTASGKITSNTALIASAVYGQNHPYWFHDEAALFAGPSGEQNFYTKYSAVQTDKFLYEDDLIAQNRFNCLLMIPVESLAADGSYDPLASLAELNRELNSELEQDFEILPDFYDAKSADGKLDAYVDMVPDGPATGGVSFGNPTVDPDALPWAAYFDPYMPEPVSQPHILTYALIIGGAILAAGILTVIILSAKKKKKG